MKPIYHRIGIKCQILYKWHLQRKIAGVWLIRTRNERTRAFGGMRLDRWLDTYVKKKKNGKERKWLYKLKEKRCCSLSYKWKSTLSKGLGFSLHNSSQEFLKFNQTFDTEELRRAESPDRITSSSKMSFGVTFLKKKEQIINIIWCQITLHNNNCKTKLPTLRPPDRLSSVSDLCLG